MVFYLALVRRLQVAVCSFSDYRNVCYHGSRYSHGLSSYSHWLVSRSSSSEIAEFWVDIAVRVIIIYMICGVTNNAHAAGVLGLVDQCCQYVGCASLTL